MQKKHKLFLHIGSHKTGTTTIQAALRDNHDILAKQGFAFACAAPYANLHTALDWVTPRFLPRGLRIKDSAALAQTLTAPAQDTIIASSENFSFFFEKNSIEVLHTLLREHFEHIEIVVYLRRQDLHAVSHHQEGAKPARAAEEALYGYATTALPTYTANLDIYLDYEQRIGMWIDVFGINNITLRIFERERLDDGDTLVDFLNVVGIDAQSLRRIETKNISLGLSPTKLGHMMNARGIGIDLKQKLLDATVADDRMMPARAEAQVFYARYRESNIRLNARLGHTQGQDLFSDDFSSYPQEPRDRWTENSSDAVIGMLLDRLTQHDRLAQADDMRDAAMLAHGAGNGILALRLMHYASILRPEGLYIREKYKEFEAKYGGGSA